MFKIIHIDYSKRNLLVKEVEILTSPDFSLLEVVSRKQQSLYVIEFSLLFLKMSLNFCHGPLHAHPLNHASDL